MVAFIRKYPNGPITGLHRTFLTTAGRKNPEVEKVKRMLGLCKGGALWPDYIGKCLAIAEGIETALGKSHRPIEGPQCFRGVGVFSETGSAVPILGRIPSSALNTSAHGDS
jgi:hypothetical protein